MGELSDRNRKLVAAHVDASLPFRHQQGRTVVNVDDGTLNRLLDAARSEAQPSGLDGGKSLGERLYEAFTEGNGWGWADITASSREHYEKAALTFTASLSDASPSSGDE